MKIVAAIPSRGILVTEAINSVLQELSHFPGSEVVFSWDLPMPECHNNVAKQALDKGADYVWLVEEDVLVPPGTLQKLLDADNIYVCADLPSKDADRRSYVARWPVNDPVYDIYWSHVGCTLVKREAFEILPYPWFENHYMYEVDTSNGSYLKFRKHEHTCDYGGHDMVFGMKLRQEGYTLKDIKVVCTHCKVSLNSAKSNDGRHVIEKFDTVERSSAIHDVMEDFIKEGVSLKEEDFTHN